MLKTLNGSACCCFYRPPLHTPLKMFLFLIFFRVHSPLALHTFFFFFSHRVEPTPNTWKMEGRRGEREAVEKIKTFKWKQHRKIICASPRTACASSQCLLVSIIFLLHQHQPPAPARNSFVLFFRKLKLSFVPQLPRCDWPERNPSARCPFIESSTAGEVVAFVSGTIPGWLNGPRKSLQSIMKICTTLRALGYIHIDGLNSLRFTWRWIFRKQLSSSKKLK